ncbi:hypothetical protein PMLGA01_060012100 [Plasmodium malariae]|uniref:Histone deacetylase n=1 Tax=Plasmodium malariae TaxID=5858 RepID=A0A1C3KB10_PLAMA|nr:hypothetical protein PMLGA01_060012100 [Plasmodium malariae]
MGDDEYISIYKNVLKDIEKGEVNGEQKTDQKMDQKMEQKKERKKGELQEGEQREQQRTILFYLSGVDISVDDDLGLLYISDEGIYNRDYFTYQMAIKKKLPIVTVFSGGYNECDKTLAQKHILTFK